MVKCINCGNESVDIVCADCVEQLAQYELERPELERQYYEALALQYAE
jgi:hypothetical protein